MKKFLATILTIVITFFLILATSNFLSYDKRGSAKYNDYYQHAENYDILFLGSSHALMGVLPTELWQEYQISSYNLSNYGQWLSVDYWMLQAALQRHTPKLVVLDTFSINVDEKYSDSNLVYLHDTFDHYQYPILKYKAATDLFPTNLKADFLFPFSLYHSNWDCVSANYFLPYEKLYFFDGGSDPNASYGATNAPTFISPQTIDTGLNFHSKSVTPQTTGKHYLRKIIELCKKNDIQILLTTIPFAPASEFQIQWANSIEDIAKEYNINYYNGLSENIINYNTDMYDAGHLNSLGAQKWSCELGKYICQQYDIPVYESGKIYDYWNTYLTEKSIPHKIEALKSQTNLYNYLLLATDESFSVNFYIDSTATLSQDTVFLDLINNLLISDLYENFSYNVKIGEPYYDISYDIIYHDYYNIKKSYPQNFNLLIEITDSATGAIIDVAAFWDYQKL